MNGAKYEHIPDGKTDLFVFTPDIFRRCRTREIMDLVIDEEGVKDRTIKHILNPELKELTNLAADAK